MLKELGHAVNSRISQTRYTIGFFGKILRSVFPFILQGHASYKILVMQILFTFVEALGISSLLALGIGAAVNIFGASFLANISQKQLIYQLLIIAITRELGPLLTAFLIIARSATAIATEVAGMVIGHEIEAFVSIGIDPIEHIAIPRFLGVTISLLLLNIYFCIFGLFGSFFVTLLINPLPAAEYFDNLLQVIALKDLFITFIKSVVFGMIISTFALLHGFSVERASTEIPIAALKAVTSSFAWCILADVIISVLYYIS